MLLVASNFKEELELYNNDSVPIELWYDTVSITRTAGLQTRFKKRRRGEPG